MIGLLMVMVGCEAVEPSDDVGIDTVDTGEPAVKDPDRPRFLGPPDYVDTGDDTGRKHWR